MKKFLSLVLALVMTMSLVTISAGAKDFTDADKVTYTEAVDVLSAVKVIDGYTDGSFKPTTQLNRGQAAKILCNMILGPTTAAALKADAAPFKDVAVDNTFAGYIAYCAKEGIIDGYTDGTFRPSAPLTGYAFMKLLLGALGYDKSVEGYNGANWSINVAKQALSIGLDDGLVDDFDGTKIVTREEACLFALNTLKADMVEYDAKTSVNVGDATVVIAGSKAKAVEYKDGKYDGRIDPDDVLQFGEKYFTDLELNWVLDSFDRPANQWKVKAKEVGTYTHKADATYTKSAKLGDIYKDLGLGKTLPATNVLVSVDGAGFDDDLSMNIKKGDDENSYGGNGVLTQVFYLDDVVDGKDYAIITMVNTYVGEVVKTVPANGNKDAYVVVAKDSEVFPKAAANKTLEFTTDEKFEDGAKVLYTYSFDDEAVKSLAVAEKVSGTVTRAENDTTNEDAKKALTINGETYKASKKVAGEKIGEVTVKNDYTIYLDSYGYMIFIEENEFLSSDYAFVKSAANAGLYVGKKAELVFTDGTSKLVTTAKDYSKGSANDLVEKIVTYKVDADGVYTLREVSSTQSDGTKNTTAKVDSKLFSMTNDKAGIKVGFDAVANKDKIVTANSATVFVVEDNTTKDDEYAAYTGIKNAPTIQVKDMDVPANGIDPDEEVVVYYFCKNGSMATVMFIFPGDEVDVQDDSNKTVFLANESVSNLIHDADGDYFEFNAIVDGELKTVKVDVNVKVKKADGTEVTLGKGGAADANTLNGLFKSYSMDKHGIITMLREYTVNYTGNTDATSTVNAKGIAKVSKEYTVKLGTTSGENLVITVDKDAKVYYVDKDGKVSESSYSGIVVDDNDLVYAVVKDYMVKTLVIEQVEATKTADEANVVLNNTNDLTKIVVGEAATLTAKITPKTYKQDIQSIKWYVSNSDKIKTIDELNAALKAKDVVTASIVNGTTYDWVKEIATCPIDTTKADTYYYYVVVTTYSDKADGNGTLQSLYAIAKVIVKDAPMTITVNYFVPATNTTLASKTVVCNEAKDFDNIKAENYDGLGYKCVNEETAKKDLRFEAGKTATVTYLYAIPETPVTTMTITVNYVVPATGATLGTDTIECKDADAIKAIAPVKFENAGYACINEATVVKPEFSAGKTATVTYLYEKAEESDPTTVRFDLSKAEGVLVSLNSVLKGNNHIVNGLKVGDVVVFKLDFAAATAEDLVSVNGAAATAYNQNTEYRYEVTKEGENVVSVETSKKDHTLIFNDSNWDLVGTAPTHKAGQKVTITLKAKTKSDIALDAYTTASLTAGTPITGTATVKTAGVANVPSNVWSDGHKPTSVAEAKALAALSADGKLYVSGTGALVDYETATFDGTQAYAYKAKLATPGEYAEVVVTFTTKATGDTAVTAVSFS